MRYSNRGRNVPHVNPIRRVELSESNVKLRMILVVVLLAVASVAIVVGLNSALMTEPGWQSVDVQSVKANCGADFVLDYDFSDAGSGATSAFKKLTTLYSTACEDAYRIFSVDVPGEGTANVHDLNSRPNEKVTVDPALYEAFSLLQRAGSRHIYLGGVYAEYGRIFSAETEVEAASYDPAQNPDLVEDISALAAFAADSDMIDLQLLGDNQVMLYVSDAYLAFADQYEIESLIDFGWMKNAFIADYLAQVLTDNGFTNGYLASFDGFTRNLDTRGNTYSFNVFDRQGKDIYVPAALTYSSPSSLVFLRDYPLGKSDVWHYFAFQNGHIASYLIDPADGMNKASIDSLVCYSKDQGCAQLLLEMIPVVICEDFSAQDLLALTTDGIHSIWCEDTTVFYTDPLAMVSVLPQEELSYTTAHTG